MDCPGCRAAMTGLTLEGRLGGSVTIDLCAGCQAIWFDHGESLQLSPGATLQIFRRIGESAAARRGPLPASLCCPRCGQALLRTHDRQRNTPFEYWRCDAGDGRLIGFFDFLREKDFIRPLSPAQVEELRRNLQTVSCSSCGAPVDLARGASCAHCGSPLSMLDLEHTHQLIAELQQADHAPGTVDPGLPLELLRARREVETAFASFEHQPRWLEDVSSAGVVGAGLMALARWLGKPAG
ncbi:MAG TPA: zf-TFIIB domain-containing protein [Vicinamibacteria bacterium]|nr:zf-TFIIB domain-containing protein [Vicinamibacteria bacterium]